MVEHRIKVFVSSTQKDQEERHRQVVEIIEAFPRLEAVSQQRFTAEVVDSVTADSDKVRSSWLVIFLLGHRYGSVPHGKDKSFVELEYEAACRYGTDRLVFFEEESSLSVGGTTPRNVDDGDNWHEAYARQKALKARATNHPAPQACPFLERKLPALVVKALLQWAEHRGLQLVKEQQVAPAQALPVELLTAYRERVQQTYQYLPLIGLPQNLRLPVRLESLWVPLHGDASRARREKHPGSHDPEPLQPGGGKPLLLVYADGITRGFVLTGYPGSGKTTYLKKLALQCLTDPPLGLPRDVVPVYLPLRQLREEDLTLGLEYLLARALHHVPTKEDRDGYRRLLRERGRLLLLFDGLDEVPRDLRQRVVEWIQASVAGQDCWFGVTSRPIAGHDLSLGDNVAELQVSPLGDAEADDFVRKWHEVVVPEHATERAAALLAHLETARRRHIRLNELRKNPLLLTILCLVWRDRQEALSTERVELYQDCVQVLLDRWRLAGLTVQWSPRQALRILQPVALHLHTEHRARTGRGTVEDLVQRGLDAIGLHSRARDFLRDLGEETGLFAHQGNEEFGFLHLCLQEYLAARELQRRTVASVLRGVPCTDLAAVASHLVRNHGKPGDDGTWWHEVVDLLLTLDGAPMLGPLLRELLDVAGWTKLRTEIERWRAHGDERDLAPLQAVCDDPNRDAMEKEVAEGLLGTSGTRRSNTSKPHAEPATQLPLQRRVREQLGMTFVKIPTGSFLMGSPLEEESRSPDEPQRKVRIPKGFWLATTPVSNQQYRAFVEATKSRAPSSWNDRRFNGDEQPVVGVSWDEAQAFCKWAGLRLPSEAEWEYACRAGTTTPFSFGANITPAQVNYDGDYPYVNGAKGEDRERTVPVGSLPANAWGLHEMHGNVWEWCEDWYGDYGNAPVDGSAQQKDQGSGRRVLRGGSWLDGAGRCRSAYRDASAPGGRDAGVGFRPASSSL